MKQLTFLSIFAVSILFFSCNGKAQNQDKNKAKAVASTNKIEVIDFYGTHRCVTCKAIEASAKYTLDTHYSEEQKDGTIVFKAINVDEEKNYKIAESFEATGTALFLNVIKNGKETHINLTDFAFEKGRDQEAFSKELKSKIDAELKNI